MGTLWCGYADDKLYLSSGFSGTLDDSVAIGSIDNLAGGIATDGTDTIWCGNAGDKLYKQSGFSGTLKDSVGVSSLDTLPQGISWDGANVLWIGSEADKLYKCSGFSSTLLGSGYVGGYDIYLSGISWDGTDCLWCGTQNDKLFRNSGFSDVLVESVSISSIGTDISGISWDGTDILWCDRTDLKLFKCSGFSNTIKASPSIAAIETLPYGIGHDDLNERLGGALERNVTLLATRITHGLELPPRGRIRRWGHPALLAHVTEPSVLLGTRVFPGRRDRHRSTVRQPQPHLIAWARRYLDGRGRYRIFNDAEYRFYRSNSGPPAESDSPFATSASLPHEPTDTYGDGTWCLSVSYFNGVIDSGFLPLGPHGETYLRLDIASGAAAGSPPQGPGDWRLELGAAGVVRVVGFYFEYGSLRANEWALAYTTDGSTPAADAPDVTVPMAVHGLAILSYDLPGQSHGTTVKVRLQTRRQAAAWVYSEASTVRTATADAQGPTAALAGERWAGPLPVEED